MELALSSAGQEAGQDEGKLSPREDHRNPEALHVDQHADQQQACAGETGHGRQASGQRVPQKPAWQVGMTKGKLRPAQEFQEKSRHNE